ncbi:MAG: transketolase [Nitrospirae bacterium]|nr:transketolase [Nitrospirota bacterium]
MSNIKTVVEEASAFELDKYTALAVRIRKTILDMIYRTKSPHIGPSFSIVEILTALYFRFLNANPDDAHNPVRDRFILSKGHACAALYAVLAERGFMGNGDLDGFAVNGGRLEQHPNHDVMCGIEVSTGSLGHGLSIGAGMALSSKIDRRPYNAYVLLGDGELNEGSVWESVMFAGHHKLNNLIAIIDYNKIQALGCTRDIIDLNPLGRKWESFGWDVQEIDGHDFEQIFNAMSSLSPEKPNVIILHTIKGKGVSFMQDQVLWHYRAPDELEYKRALKELLL